MRNTTWIMMIAGLFAGIVNAGLVWQADFESYSAGSDVTINATGDDDTFTSWIGSSSSLDQQLTAVDASSYGLIDGLSGKLTSGNSYTSDKSVRLHQDAIGNYGTGDALVLSFDRVRSADSHWSNLGMWFSDSDGVRLGGTGLSFSDAAFFGATKVGRVTMVLNLTGASIALPGSLGSLASGYYAVFGKDNYNGSYVGLVTKAITETSGIAGFTLDHIITGGEAVPNYQFLDNMFVADSVNDEVGGINVLELDFGTVVPEPATIGMLGLGALITILCRQRMR